MGAGENKRDWWRYGEEKRGKVLSLFLGGARDCVGLIKNPITPHWLKERQNEHEKEKKGIERTEEDNYCKKREWQIYWERIGERKMNGTGSKRVGEKKRGW